MAYLWVYTMALGLVVMLIPGIAGWIERWLAPLLSGVLLLVVPSLLFAVFRLTLLPHFPSTHALFGDWYNHALFASVFLLGFLLAHAASFWDAIERQRWIALALAVALFLSWIALRGVRDGGLPLRLYANFAYGFYQWLCIVAVLGFARRWLTKDSAARRYLTDAIFPYYIVHQTAIIMIAHGLRGSGLSAGVEAAIIIGGTAATCIVTLRDRAARRLAPAAVRAEAGNGGIGHADAGERAGGELTILPRWAYRCRPNALYGRHGRAHLSRLERDHAASPRGEGGDGACLGDRRQPVLRACRGPRGAAAGRGGARRGRSRGRRRGAERHLHVGRHGSQFTRTRAGPPSRQGAGDGTPAGLRDRACLGAGGRALRG